MKSELPGAEGARYCLAGVQAIAHENGVILRRGTARVFIEGEGVIELLHMLVQRGLGGRGFCLDEILDEVPAERREALVALIRALKERRLLVEMPASPGADAPRPAEGREQVFYWNYGTTAEAVADTLAGTNLAIFGVNTISSALADNLIALGFRSIRVIDHPALRNLDMFEESGRIRDSASARLATRPLQFEDWIELDERPDCFVVCSDFGGLSLMREWNAYCVEHGNRFFPVVLQDQIAYAGPMVVPREGPCYECFWRRQNSNLEAPALTRAGETAAFLGQNNTGFLMPMARAAADVAAMEIVKFFSRALPGGNVGTVVEIDLMEPSLKARKLLKLPRCPVCSSLKLHPMPAADAAIFMPGNE